MTTFAPFPIDPVQTGIAIAYKNESYIADQVLPDVPVGRQSFKYNSYDLGDEMRIPETRVGRTSQPNEVEFGYTESTDSCVDNALDDPIPQADLMNAPDNYNPINRAVEKLTDLIMLGREKRVATLVQTAGNYPTGNKATLSGTDQWSHASSDPLSTIMDAMDTMIMRPNVMVLSQEVLTALSRHATIVKAFNGNSGDSGIAPANFIASLFGLQKVLVGGAWNTTSKEGQTTTSARVWGKHCALLRINPNAGAGDMPTFGFTANWGGRVAGSWEDKNIGMRGGTRVRVGESTKELICASDMGYLFTDAVA